MAAPKLRAWPHQVVLGRDGGVILAARKLQFGQGAYPVRVLGSMTGPAPDGYVTESSQTFIHWDSVRSHAEAASQQAPTLASHAPVPLIPTPPCCLPSHAPGFQPSAMEDASSPRERKKLQGSITSERGVPAATYR